MAAVHVYPADESACGMYRLRWPAEALAAQGYDVKVFEPGPVGWAKLLRADDGVLVGVRHPDCETVVIQRPMSAAWPHAVTQLRNLGVRVVVDIDDDLDSIDARHPAWSLSPSALHECCKRADMVTVSTPALADRYGYHNRRITVIPNCVPGWYLSVRPDHSTTPPATGLRVGSTISAASHPGDLAVIRGGLASAQRVYGFQLHVIGNPDGYRAALGVDPLVTPRLPLPEYPYAVAKFDIGIAPLASSAFNECKSWLRPLEFAALGVPYVASPTTPYQALDHGLYAATPKQWEGALKHLCRDWGAREDIAAAGRARAAQWTIEGRAELWADAWQAPPVRHPSAHRPRHRRIHA